MAQVTAIVVLVLAGLLGVLGGALVWRGRKQRKAQASVRHSGPLPRVPARSQVIQLPQSTLEGEEEARPSEPAATEAPVAPASAQPAPELPDVIAAPNPVLDVHQAPTREFAAHIEALAALTSQGAMTRAIAVHDAKTREFSACDEHLLAPQAPEVARPASSVNDRVRVASGVRPRITDNPRERDATLKVGRRSR